MRGEEKDRDRWIYLTCGGSNYARRVPPGGMLSSANWEGCVFYIDFEEYLARFRPRGKSGEVAKA